MIRTPYARFIRKRPRKFHKFIPILSLESDCCEYCSECMEGFQAEVDRDRPGHLWRVEDGKVRYKEDDVMEKHLGRKLKENETVIIKNDNPNDCSIENLEIVEIPDMGTEKE